MKAQTALEFLVLASVLSLVAVSIIAYYVPIYKSEGSIEGSAFRLLGVNSLIKQPVLAQVPVPKALVYLSNISYLGKVGYLQMVVEDCNGKAHIFANSSDSSNSSRLVFLYNTSSAAVDGIGVIELPYFPQSTGLAYVKIKYELECDNATYSNSTTLSTYVFSSNSSSTPIYARLADVKEGIAYSFAKQIPIIYTTQSTRCTITNFYYQPLPLAYQCGTQNVWGYEQFSISCYYNVGGTDTTTTCIYPHNTTYSTSNITGSFPLYSFILHIYTPLGIINASLSNSTPSAPVFIGSKNIGTANVVKVNFFPNSSILESGLVWNDSKSVLAKPAAFSNYINARQNMYSTLSYYNSTLTYSQNIYQALAEYQNASKLLLNSTQNSSCQILANSLVCGAGMPFDYLVDVHLNGINLNESLQYFGSEINVE